MYYNKKELELLRQIITSPTYKLAEDDKEFLREYEVRGVRLELDYLKAELVMKRYGIEDTIVVFGSARILPKEIAQKHLEKLQSIGADTAALKDAQKKLEMSRYYEDARKLGYLIGSSGKAPSDNRVMVMTGGGPGIMEAANRGAYEAGANSIGLNITLPREQHPNPYITPGLCFLLHYIAIRKLHFFQRAKAMVVYPGGFGTLDEFFELLTLIQTGTMPKIPVILVGKAWWSRLIDFDFLIEERMIAAEDLKIFHPVENAKEAWRAIVQWYKEHGNPLFSPEENDSLGS